RKTVKNSDVKLSIIKELSRFISVIVEDDRKLVWNEEVDILYIDTSHDYEHTLFEMNKIAYPIKEFEDIGFVSIRKLYLEKYPGEVKKFIKAIRSANYYVATNKDQVFKWFSEDSNFDLNLVKNLKVIEPNFEVKTVEEVDLGITQFWIEEVQKKIDFMFEEGLINRRFNLTGG
ncbi:MAG: hypothetical protein AABY10_03015, partial [Nanoarchaeota archaeon]